ncbi:MAG: hypothetical protein IIA87_04885, partial [Nanoarchaeota archaeon]|nr:hypothetical protein [Nanoarchaeota archaeon]
NSKNELVSDLGNSEFLNEKASNSWTTRPESLQYYFVTILVSDDSINLVSSTLVVLELTGKACNDGIDNDGDGWIDYLEDPGCGNAEDDDESNPNTEFECSDGIDNDGDGLTDGYDPDCIFWFDNNETKTLPQCSDGIDNDDDGLIDYPDDPGCDSLLDDDERDEILLSECEDGIDNDRDSLIDFPEDLGCSSPNDQTESAENRDLNAWYYADFPDSLDPLTIEWDKFPTFSLSNKFTLVYQGPHFNDSSMKPLSHGFTHLDLRATPNGSNIDVPVKNRALLWTSVATGAWGRVRSPWITHAEAVAHWSRRLDGYAGLYGQTTSYPKLPEVDIIYGDVERYLTSRTSILNLKNDPSTPPEISLLGDDDFVDRYKRDMSKLYTDYLVYLTERRGYQGTVSSYSDIPLTGKSPAYLRLSLSISWSGYTTQPTRLNYILLNHTSPSSTWASTAEFGPFYDKLDHISPSNYYYSDYPDNRVGIENITKWDIAAGYLAYQAFAIEVNDVWMKSIVGEGQEKSSIQFQWLLFCDFNQAQCTDRFKPIRPHMAHATAIFPYFSGAEGVWLWDNANSGNYPIGSGAGIPGMKYEVYEHYVYGLYRLSRYNTEFFDGNYQIYIPQGKNPRDLLVNKEPVWRGIINEQGDKMLVAAHNPFAEPTETTFIPIENPNNPTGLPLETIEINGLDTYLGVFDI